MLLLSEFHQNMKSGMITVEVVFEGVRFRPVVFTPLMASEGLLPLVLLTGKGSESQTLFDCGYRWTCDGGFFGFIVIPHFILTLTEKKSLNSYKALSYNSFFSFEYWIWKPLMKKSVAKKWMKTGEISLKKKMFVEIYL